MELVEWNAVQKICNLSFLVSIIDDMGWGSKRSLIFQGNQLLLINIKKVIGCYL